MFRATLEKAIGVERPPPVHTFSNRVTNLEALRRSSRRGSSPRRSAGGCSWSSPTARASPGRGRASAPSSGAPRGSRPCSCRSGTATSGCFDGRCPSPATGPTRARAAGARPARGRDRRRGVRGGRARGGRDPAAAARRARARPSSRASDAATSRSRRTSPPSPSCRSSSFSGAATADPAAPRARRGRTRHPPPRARSGRLRGLAGPVALRCVQTPRCQTYGSIASGKPFSSMYEIARLAIQVSASGLRDRGRDHRRVAVARRAAQARSSTAEPAERSAATSTSVPISYQWTPTARSTRAPDGLASEPRDVVGGDEEVGVRSLVSFPRNRHGALPSNEIASRTSHSMILHFDHGERGLSGVPSAARCGRACRETARPVRASHGQGNCRANSDGGIHA